ncbi:MAG: hypothetical protein ACE14L_15535 [Terriglobales bacterium]
MSDQPETSSAGATSSPAVLRAVIIGLLIAIVVAAAFGFHQRNTARQLQAQNQQIASALRETQGQIDTLNARMAALAAPPPPAPAPVVEAPAKRPAVVKPATAKRRRVEDSRWKKMQAQLDAQGRAIESTRQDLTTALDSTRSELSGSIARTHEELVLLQKKGERNYHEFDIVKSKQFQPSGPVAIRLKKANTKKQYADLELMVDDVKLTQKHVNLLQPVQFYAGDGGAPVELVINRITKNQIHGYVSAPKYTRSELAAAAPANSTGTPATTAGAGPTTTAAAQQPPPARRKLDFPK